MLGWSRSSGHTTFDNLPFVVARRMEIGVRNYAFAPKPANVGQKLQSVLIYMNLRRIRAGVQSLPVESSHLRVSTPCIAQQKSTRQAFQMHRISPCSRVV